MRTAGIRLRLVATSVAALAAAGSFPCQPARATFEGRPGLIAYGTLDPDGGIFSVLPDGRRSHEIVPFGRDMEWSPDGSRLVFAKGVLSALWRARADGTHKVAILRPTEDPSVFHGYDFYVNTPTWAPDGERVAFTALVLRGDVLHPRVCTIGVDGHHLQTLAIGNDPAWSPAGTIIAFTRGAGHNTLVAVRSNGRHLRLLYRGDPRDYIESLSFSPDGTKLAFVVQPFTDTGVGPASLHVLDVRTGRSYAIARSVTGPGLEDAVWTPNGKRIAYLYEPEQAPGTRALPTELYTVTATGRGKHRLFAFPYDARLGMWAQQLAWQALPRR